MQRLLQPATEAELRAAFSAVYDVSQEEILEALETHDIGHLHEGEQELSVHALKREDAWLMSGPDAASMNFGCSVGHADRLVSLEQDSSPSSVTKTLSYKTIIKLTGSKASRDRKLSACLVNSSSDHWLSCGQQVKPPPRARPAL